MADVQGTFYQATKVKVGTSPSSPGLISGTVPVNPVNPEGTTIGHVPVSIGGYPNGLTIDATTQVLNLEIGDGLGVDGYGRLEATGGGGGTPTAAVIGRYDIDTSGTTAPVGTKDIRYNNATQISATELFISDLTEDNIDVDLFLSLIKEGSALVIQDRDDHLNYQTYEVSGTPSFASATWTFPVTFKDSGGTGTTNFANNHKALLSTFSAGGGGGGGGHVIKTNGTPLTQRAGLNFSTEFTVTDDAANDETDVAMNTNIMATKAYVDGGANSTNAASRLYLFNNY